jgi:EpsD family peptidyl-prolyl cis-trans isomerase
MTLPFSPSPRRARRIAAARATAVAVAVGVALLAGCSKNKDKQSTQVAAKVNKEEITISQVNFLLAQQRPVAASQAASANRAALERLIDQELTIQKASDQRLDREPRVVQQIEMARREIISRAYLEKVGAGASKPSPTEVQAYYEAHPALFSQRRIYSLQEVNIEATPDQVEAMKKTLVGSKTFADFVAYLKNNNFKFAAAEAVRSAEQLPLASVDAFGKMKDGQAIFNTRPGGAQVINLAGSRSEPVTLERATPAIEQFLVNERKRKMILDDMAALRRGSKVEYFGDFAADAERNPYEPPLVPDEPVKTPPITQPIPEVRAASQAISEVRAAPQAAPEVRAASQVDVPLTESKGASAPSMSTLNNGLKGSK